jgi:hypothetical protein
MKRFIKLILAIEFLTGCATHPHPIEKATLQPRQSEPASHLYSVGMSRKELRADFADSWLLVSASRPVTGWSNEVSPPAGEFAAKYESSNVGIVVASCDVYWVGHTSAPKMYYGKWLNYFYFDRNDKLIGFDRAVID